MKWTSHVGRALGALDALGGLAWKGRPSREARGGVGENKKEGAVGRAQSLHPRDNGARRRHDGIEQRIEKPRDVALRP